MPDPTAEPPLVNMAIEDLLAHATNEVERTAILHTLITISATYLAREVGRARTRLFVRDLEDFIRDAQPSAPWPR
jgi:hypothetical protein